jgi:branched-chain amino acid transport system permease protein
MKQIALPLVVLAILCALPLGLKENHQGLLVFVLLWVTIGSGWNLISGFTGQVLFGAAAFFGTGAYAAGLMVHQFQASAWWGVPLGGLASMLLALPFGWICFRLRGPYFALATLALAEIMRLIAINWESLTAGMEGISFLRTFSSTMPYYYIALALAALSVLAIQLVVNSRWGYYFVSIREDQDAAESLGINTVRYKMFSLCVAALLIGTAGGLYTNYMGSIDPEVVFSLHDISIMAILVGIVGGVGTVYGPVIGAFVMVGVQELFRSAGFGFLDWLKVTTGWSFIGSVIAVVKEAHVMSFGLLVILAILFLPNGVVGDWEAVKRSLFRGGGKAA